MIRQKDILLLGLLYQIPDEINYLFQGRFLLSDLLFLGVHNAGDEPLLQLDGIQY